VQSLDLRCHIDWLLARLNPVANAVLELQNIPEITTMLVQCIWWSKYGQGGPTLWPEQMRGLANLGIECGFDISFFGPDDEDTISQS